MIAILAILALVAFIAALANAQVKFNLIAVGGILLSLAVILQTGVIGRLT